MKSSLYLLWVILLLFSCSKEGVVFSSSLNETEETEDPTAPSYPEPVRFYSNGISVDVETRAIVNDDFVNDTLFSNDDHIGIFAANCGPTADTQLFIDGNYADNVKYRYQDGEFVSVGSNPIYQYEGTYKHNLVYYAVFPYIEALNPVGGTFYVQTDQRSLPAYEQSDLAFAKVTSMQKSVTLTFERQMSLVHFTLHHGNNQFLNTTIRVELLGVHHGVRVNLNDDETPFTAMINEHADVSGYSATYNAKERDFLFIIPPQTLPAESPLFRVTIDSQPPVELKLAEPVTLVRGKQWDFTWTYKAQ